jgi:hypothetical protein
MKIIYSKRKGISMFNLAEIDELKDNPIIENFGKILSEHLAYLVKNFIYFDKGGPFINSPSNFGDGLIEKFIAISIEYLIQQWSVIYTNEIICMSNL